MSSSASASAVCVVADIAPEAYADARLVAASLEEVCCALMALANIFTSTALVPGADRLLVLGLMHGKHITLYPRDATADATRAVAGSAAEVIRESLARELGEHVPSTADVRPALAPALARCLCWIHKARGGVAAIAAVGGTGNRQHELRGGAANGKLGNELGGGPASDARILTILASPDPPEQYVSVMNAIFASQSASVMVDGIALHRSSAGELPQSEYLHQLCSMTGGSYIQPQREDALVNYCKLFMMLGKRQRKSDDTNGVVSGSGWRSIGNRGRMSALTLSHSVRYRRCTRD